MKCRVLLFCILCLSISRFALAQEAYLAWFTGATIENSAYLPTPPSPPTLVSGGTVGNCLDMTAAVGISGAPLTSMQTKGAINFWLRPKWDGKVSSGGSTHKILKIGDPTTNGLQIEVNNTAGVLRFIMAGKNGAATKVTVVRADVSTWKSGDWHHVQVAWIDSQQVAGAPIGLGVWIDRVYVASTVFGGTAFMDPSTMADTKVYVGDTTSSAYMDELILRTNLATYQWNDIEGGVAIAHRDFFRTAPYTAIQITNAPQRVSSDARAVVGYQKQFGVTATRTVNVTLGTTVIEPITCYDGPTDSQWDAWDAKPYIGWTSSNQSRATVNTNGMVTGVSTGTCTLTATYRGMSANYSLTVVSANQADLDLMYVERTPRYHNRDAQIYPNTGDTVTSIVHYGNFGTTSANNFIIRFELMPDANGNFKPDDAVTTTINRTITTALAAGATRTENFNWTWPALTSPAFVRVTIDAGSTVNEICEANNQRCELNTARAVVWGFDQATFTSDYTNKTMNLVGSFSDYDWCNANVDRIGVMMRDAVWSTTSTSGIQDATRVDNYLTVAAYTDDHNDPLGSLYDGGFEEMWDTRMTLSPGNIHEMGHNVLGLPDLYGHGVWCTNLLLKDANSALYGNTPVYPNVGIWEDNGPWSSATYDYPNEIGGGYPPLMINNHLWLDRQSAGWVQKYRHTRKGLWYYAGDNNFFGSFIPTTNKIQLYDINDAVLMRASVYVYQCTNTGYFQTWNKYYPDRQKFFGTSNTSGLFTFPTTTGQYWDDWETAGIEGAVSSPTPFSRGATGTVLAACPSWLYGEMLLIKIVGANGQVEFHTLPLTEFNDAYLSGNTSTATYVIRTNLTSPASAGTEQAPKTTYAGGQSPTTRVVFNGVTYSADWQEVTIPAGTLTFNGATSSDPEGKALLYRWDGPAGQATTSSYSMTVTPGDYDVKLFVIDGTCFGREVDILVHAQ